MVDVVEGLQGWDLDIETGHLAHESGLYAYVDSNPTPTGALRCVGPFSAHTTHIRLQKMRRITAEAIRILEGLPGYENVYTLWGSHARRTDAERQMIRIMNKDFQFVPNPSFRTSLILSPRDNLAKEQLTREWEPSLSATSIKHKLGLSFSFNTDISSGNLRCAIGGADKLDEYAMCTHLFDVSIKALSSTAFRVLSLESSAKPGRRDLPHLEITLSTDLDIV